MAGHKGSLEDRGIVPAMPPQLENIWVLDGEGLLSQLLSEAEERLVSLWDVRRLVIVSQLSPDGFFYSKPMQ